MISPLTNPQILRHYPIDEDGKFAEIGPCVVCGLGSHFFIATEDGHWWLHETCNNGAMDQ
jgi:hypothetical protein